MWWPQADPLRLPPRAGNVCEARVALPERERPLQSSRPTTRPGSPAAGRALLLCINSQLSLND
jgi:hypothetical protein